MKKSRFAEEQIIGVLKQHETGMKTADLCREHGISVATFMGGRRSTVSKRCDPVSPGVPFPMYMQAHGPSTMNEEPSQVLVAALADAEQRGLAASRMLLRHKT